MQKRDSILKCFDHPAWRPHAKATGSGSWFLFSLDQIMQRKRVISFIDGFNLYHAINNLHRPELKWLNLMSLSQIFLQPNSEELSNVFYFSAYADHMNEPIQKRQKAYIQALEIKRVVPILGHFKRKDRKCPKCQHKWEGHEEKETDVNIALFLLDQAYQNTFDRALVISNDSDLSPAIRMVRSRFPEKRITTVAPPHYFHSNELIKASSDKTKIRIEHLERCLLPHVVSNDSLSISVNRPKEYIPPLPKDKLLEKIEEKIRFENISSYQK